MADWPYGLTLKPIVTWPTAMTRNRKMSQFSAPLRATLKQLDSELASIKAKDVVMQIALEASQFRLDGYPRSTAKPEHPGIIITMTTPDGALSFPCDTFTEWTDNLRAIVLTMQKFRDIARYGVTKNGQQYAGFRAIEGARPAPAAGFADTDDAIAYLRQIAKPDGMLFIPELVRRAKRFGHPDHGGTAETFQRVLVAEDYLKQHGEL